MVDDSPAPAAITVFSDLPQSDSSPRGALRRSPSKAGLPVPKSPLGIEISPVPQSITVILLQGCFSFREGKVIPGPSVDTLGAHAPF